MCKNFPCVQSESETCSCAMHFSPAANVSNPYVAVSTYHTRQYRGWRDHELHSGKKKRLWAWITDGYWQFNWHASVGALNVRAATGWLTGGTLIRPQAACVQFHRLGPIELHASRLQRCTLVLRQAPRVMMGSSTANGVITHNGNFTCKSLVWCWLANKHHCHVIQHLKLHK